jgi:xylulose-5-phosphate/fructose-6-phosphate phosphoketolase
MLGTPVDAALQYWRAATALAGSHVFGMTWPPPGRPLRSRLVGHWGANPGIAWIVGHLASHWREEEPFLLAVGTGHANSFTFAHEALRSCWTSGEICAAIERYGQPGGDPPEFVGWPLGVPLVSGELGPAIAVSQALAVHQPERMVVCIIGDGEFETPTALAGLLHRKVLFGNRPVRWLLVVNANGATMGGPARYDGDSISRCLGGMGYETICSDDDAHRASIAAREALSRATNGNAVVWVSATKKGWPAPDPLLDRSFRGASAHKPPAGLNSSDPQFVKVIGEWLSTLTRGIIEYEGKPLDEVVDLARCATFTLPDVKCQSGNLRQDSPSPLPLFGWSSPVAAADLAIADSGATVYSPDEASSNRLFKCLERGTVIEVLSEETCFAWTLGTVEAGQPAVFATYEAFAPLISSQVAQYSKLISNRPARGTPPVLVLVSSLGWANSPTHQNTDLAATIIARPFPNVSLLCPLGATSAKIRLAQTMQGLRDSLAVVVCSKQNLFDLPDPGGAAVEIALAEADRYVASIVAVGDVCVTEAVAAMIAAAQSGVCVRVVAIVDVTAVDPERCGAVELIAEEPAVGIVWCAPRIMESLLWSAAGRMFSVHGYREKTGATPWETLRKNQMDRQSLLAAIYMLTNHNGLDAGSSETKMHGPAEPPRIVLPAVAVRSLSTAPGDMTNASARELVTATTVCSG